MKFAGVIANAVLAAGISALFLVPESHSAPQLQLSRNNSSRAIPLIRKPRLPSSPSSSRNGNRYVPSTGKWNATIQRVTSTTTVSTTTIEATSKRADIVDSVSSDDKLAAVSWPVPRRPLSKRFKPPSQASTTLSPLEKLRKPRPSRPAMYSLDGFVPKPSPQFKPTTEAPADVLAWKQDLQALGSITRRRKVTFGNEAAEEENTRKYKSIAKKSSTRKPSSSRIRPNWRKGVAGVDFPAFGFIPFTAFDCAEKDSVGGLYADPETKCQVWHLCPGGSSQFRHSFLCPNGTVFNERRGICDWWYNVDC